MPVQEFALDAAANSMQVFLSTESETVTVLLNRSIIGVIPSREELRAGRNFALHDGSTLKVQLVETEIQVFRNGQRLLQNPYGVPPQQLSSRPQAYYEYGVPPQGPYGAFPYPQPDNHSQTSYGYGAPLQEPYSVFPNPQPGYGTPSVQAAPLPLGEALRQLPGQYAKVAFTKRSSATFAEEQSKASWGSVWVQLIIYALGVALSVYMDELITRIASSVLDLLVFICFAVVLIPIGFFATTGIYYLIARVFGGKGTFLAQSYTTLLFTVPLGMLAGLLSLIPVFGPLATAVVGMYSTLLSIRMIMGVHRLSAGKATAVIILIPFVFILFLALLVVIVAAAIRSA